MSGVPGCGKSTLAQQLGYPVYGADDWFDNYQSYDPRLLKKAHNWARLEAFKTLKTQHAILDNTHLRHKDIKTTVEQARKCNYRIVMLAFIPDEKARQNWQKRQIHNVSPQQYNKMWQRANNRYHWSFVDHVIICNEKTPEQIKEEICLYLTAN